MASPHCGFSSCRGRALGAQASVDVIHGLSGPVAAGIFTQGLNLRPLHWQADFFFFFFFNFYFIFKLYIIVLVLPNAKMNPPQVYMCSPS